MSVTLHLKAIEQRLDSFLMSTPNTTHSTTSTADTSTTDHSTTDPKHSAPEPFSSWKLRLGAWERELLDALAQTFEITRMQSRATNGIVFEMQKDTTYHYRIRAKKIGETFSLDIVNINTHSDICGIMCNNIQEMVERTKSVCQ